MTVQETERVAIERQADRDSTFVTLTDRQEEKRNRQRTGSVELLCRINLVFMPCEKRTDNLTTKKTNKRQNYQLITSDKGN